MDKETLITLVTKAKLVVAQAADFIRQHRDQVNSDQVIEKGTNSLVSYVDQQSEEILVKGLSAILPEAGFITEEGMVEQSQKKLTWIIDPLDGTTNFLHGFPQYAVSIALMMHDKLEVAVIYDPLRQELFSATRGAGAHLNNRRIRVSATAKLDQAFIATGFPAKNHSLYTEHHRAFNTVFASCHDIRCAGSAALDLAYVACGRLDGSWESGLQPWDIAAGALLITEAGGTITAYDGSDDYMESGNVVASSFKLHPILRDMIQKN